MSDGFPVPAAQHRTEESVERSRFITTIARASSSEEARRFIDSMRAEFVDATHNCWAFVAGAPGSTAAVGFSDAGEPHGTAGRPMLDVLRPSGIGEVVAVVTRYFGGVKLGKGGLVRAYGGAVKNALATLPTIVLVERTAAVVTATYADVDALKKVIQEFDVVLLDESYGADVRFTVEVPAAHASAFERAARDRTAGRAIVE